MKIYKWKDIQKDFQDTIIIGNGGSIAVNECFKYPSIYEYALKEKLFSSKTIKLFEAFETKNFELVLKYILHAKTVNKILDIQDKNLNEQYENIKSDLINIIQKIHPEYSEIKHQLPTINQFLQKFKKVITLNYDLVLYWAIMFDNNNFIDYFTRQKQYSPLEFDVSMSRLNRTEVFYLHGNLMLGKNRYGNTVKHEANNEFNLIDSISNSWEEIQTTPLFVSEGSSDNKLSYIQNHHYLNHIYNNILPCHNHQNITIYGWSFSEQDEHILKKILGFRCRYEKVIRKKIAISVFKNNEKECLHIQNAIKDICASTLEPEIIFFHSNSDGCWNN